MAFAADYAVLFDRLDDELRVAAAPGPGLFAKIIAGACTRLPALNKSSKAAMVDRLIEAGAWTDAAFALIELELPAWKVRRLIRDDGEWFCSLSRQPGMPAWLDDTAESSHELLPLAILLAFLQARRMTGIAPESRAPVPAIQAAGIETICCDNFA